MFSSCGDIQRVPVKRSYSGNTYDCDLCDSGDWLSETEVEIHKHSMHKDQIKALVKRRKGPVCFTCAKTYDNEATLLAHIKTVHLLSSSTARRVEREIFVCDICRDIFFEKELLAVHIIHKHRNKVITKCPVCPFPMRPKQAYAHLSTRHQLQSISCCPICLSKRANRKDLAQHIDTHRKYYHCNVCGYMTNKERDYNHHLDMYDKRWDESYSKIKHECYQDLFLKPQLMKKWSPNTNRFGLKGLRIWNSVYICIICRALCTDNQEMVQHVATTHAYSAQEQKTNGYTCECGENFTTVIMLKHHVFKMKGDHKILTTTHAYSAQEQKTNCYTCECGENFTTVIMLKHHVFKMKGNHKILKEPKEPVPAALPNQECGDEETLDSLVINEENHFFLPTSDDDDQTEIRIEIVTSESLW